MRRFPVVLHRLADEQRGQQPRKLGKLDRCIRRIGCAHVAGGKRPLQRPGEVEHRIGERDRGRQIEPWHAPDPHRPRRCGTLRSEEHTSELQSLMRISYAVFCLKKKTKTTNSTKVINTPDRKSNT